MPGFTPINAPVVAQATIVADNETAAARSLKSNTRQITQDVIISQAEQQTLDGTAQTSKKPRKAPGRGKKRSRKDSHDAPQKRRKSRSVTESMTVTKPGASSTKAASDAVTGKRRSSTDRATAQSHCNEDLDDALDDALFDDLDQAPRVVQHETRPVSLYAHPTTMSSGNSCETRTTMQQVRGAPLGTSSIYTNVDASPYTTLTVGTANPRRHHVNMKLPAPPESETDHAGNIASSDSAKHVQQQCPSVAPMPSSIAPQTSSLPARSDYVSCPVTANGIELAILLSEDEFSDFEEPPIRSIYAMETSRSATPPPRNRALNKREVSQNESYGGALFSQSERDLLDSLNSKTSDHTPAVRTPFPTPILDRSPLFGVTNAVALRTCFRVGEAVNAGCQAVRMNKNVMLELYARVTCSHREPKPARKQVFEIHDLYHDHPPHLQGTFDLWDQSTLWELDSRPFLTIGPGGMLARMIARMKRDGTKWRLEILNIWQAGWDDVEHVAGIYVKSDGMPDLDD
ncbi:hypothetical protein B0A48_10632 [Cryoendolithus antarcticus]|uniref:Uncharacterized protein n=1 Tax=Cryoendolithus antarcticus TaxID=1507870 RepID=A0A1V8SY42_9PEZI|nr:hypothetical protein B0A48_10632 [Cryoendolithus antarcticus]